MLEEEDDGGHWYVGADRGEEFHRDSGLADVLESGRHMPDERYPSRLETGVDAPGDDGEEDDDEGMSEGLNEEEWSGDVRITAGQGLGGPLDTIQHDEGGDPKRRVEAGMVYQYDISGGFVNLTCCISGIAACG